MASTAPRADAPSVSGPSSTIACRATPVGRTTRLSGVASRPSERKAPVCSVALGTSVCSLLARPTRISLRSTGNCSHAGLRRARSRVSKRRITASSGSKSSTSSCQRALTSTCASWPRNVTSGPYTTRSNRSSSKRATALADSTGCSPVMPLPVILLNSNVAAPSSLGLLQRFLGVAVEHVAERDRLRVGAGLLLGRHDPQRHVVGRGAVAGEQPESQRRRRDGQEQVGAMDPAEHGPRHHERREREPAEHPRHVVLPHWPAARPSSMIHAGGRSPAGEPRFLVRSGPGVGPVDGAHPVPPVDAGCAGGAESRSVRRAAAPTRPAMDPRPLAISLLPQHGSSRPARARRHPPTPNVCCQLPPRIVRCPMSRRSRGNRGIVGVV